MKYFTAFIFDSNKFDLKYIQNTLSTEYSIANAGEEFKMLEVENNISIVVYEPGNVSSYHAGFGVSAEFLLMDDFFGQVASFAKRNTSNDFSFFAIVYRKIDEYLVVQKYSKDIFEGRASVEGKLEKIKMIKDDVKYYDCEELGQTEEEQEKQRDKYDIAFLLKELNLNWKELMNGVTNTYQKGKRIWPSLPVTGETWDDPDGELTYPIIPFWEYLNLKEK